MSAELAQRVYAAVLREDDGFRSDLPLLAELASSREELRKQRTVGLKIDSESTVKRRPWADAELKTLFTAPLHAVYELPTAWNMRVQRRLTGFPF